VCDVCATFFSGFFPVFPSVVFPLCVFMSVLPVLCCADKATTYHVHPPILVMRPPPSYQEFLDSVTPAEWFENREAARLARCAGFVGAVWVWVCVRVVVGVWLCG